ncbi:LysR family transcriptional regulator [Litchfieldia salsa]|uniref:LysR family transcriptional regulator, repressor for citA n=1 Tax=Litchfieldia salsa TaxID=930152 RepID=A0A1H0P8I8_9BACI|nr:LysR family transcriptional regulator [Litchfieldia salsa]SDP01382.1 LysR family transcriptional regulator, repressor for citA [Litchfieldia salsa]
MDFNWLQTFVVAAETENFRRASELLYISQPSVTFHIKQLEKAIGVSLFNREGKKIKLTEEGRTFLKHARKLISSYQQSLEEMNRSNQGFTRTLSIAISPLIAETILPHVLKRYLNDYPHVEISVMILESTEIEKAVLDENVDIGLSCLKGNHPETISRILSKDPVILVCSHDGMDSESAIPLDEEEVLTNNYVLTHNHPGYWDELTTIIKQKFPSIRMMKVSQTHITKRFIVEGLGVSFLPESVVRRELLEGRLMEVNCHSIQLPEASTFAVIKYEHSLQLEFLEYLSRYRL